VYFKVLLRHSLGETKENREKMSITIADNLVMFQTIYVPKPDVTS